jgi:ABC-type hemin transport system ATPase subunit
MQAAPSSLRILQQEPVKELDLVRHAHATVEIFQVCATAKRNVLAVVHMLAVGQPIGRRPATEKRPLLEHAHAPAGFS